jgi:hypothetical protein
MEVAHTSCASHNLQKHQKQHLKDESLPVQLIIANINVMDQQRAYKAPGMVFINISKTRVSSIPLGTK